jgi:hypothetical protein
MRLLPPHGRAREAGAVLPVGGPRAAVLLRAGASGVLAGNSDGGYLRAAARTRGSGARAQVAGRVGLRADVTGHALRGDSPSRSAGRRCGAHAAARAARRR